MTHNCLKIAVLSFGLAIAAGAASATPLASASKAIPVFDGSEAGVQLVHRRHVRRHGHRHVHGPSISFGFGLGFGHHGHRGFHGHGPHVGFGLAFPHGRGGHHGGFRSHSGGQGRGR